MEKIDYRKQLKHLYKPSPKKVEFVEVPEMNFLMVDGEGNPNTAKSYKEAVEALYAVSYTLKFMVKKGSIGIDYGVMPLEGLWWMDDMSNFDPDNKDEWKWTSMMMQPELITEDLVKEAVEQVRKKKNPNALDRLRFTAFHEGKAAQLMHIGPFSEEGPNIEKVHNAIAANGFEKTGKHHEIYLSDIRRDAPEKWKTVIRQPYR